MNRMEKSLGFFIHFIKNLDKFIKYQVITKLILAVAIIPIYGFLTSHIVNKSGNHLFTNSDIVKFLFSPQGFVFALILFSVIIIEVVIEIGGYILLSSRIRGGYTESSYMEILKYNIKLIPGLFSLGGGLLFLYLGIMTPMTGFGIKLSFFKGLTIPNFVLEYIDQNTLYSIIYFIMMFILMYLGIKFIFTFNFMITYKMKPLKAIISSGRLVSLNKMKVFKRLSWIFIVTFVLSILFIFLWLLFIELISSMMNLNRATPRIILIFLLQLQTFGIVGVSFLSSPFRCYCITELYYDLIDSTSLEYVIPKDVYDTIAESNIQLYPDIKEKTKESVLDKVFSYKKTLSIIILIFLFLYSAVVSLFTKEILGYNKNVSIFAHRGYGFAAPENSISAIKKSIDENIDYIEIDVQRTKDRRYVLNHDKTFKRVSTTSPSFINKKVSDLTFSQIKQLRIGGKYGEEYFDEKVPTIEDVLRLCKGKIKINLELKENVDKKMIDDIMSIIKMYSMKDEVILTSLDADVLKYIEDKDSSFNTGMIYYIKLGSYKNYNVDYMIMEEQEATKKNVVRLRNSGKKVIVWTVNSNEMMEKFFKYPIDGIITDYPSEVKRYKQRNSKIGENELILTSFFNSIDEWLNSN